VFRELDLFLSSGEEGETLMLVGPLERAKLNSWTTHASITIATYMPETRICQREITGKMFSKNCDKACTYLKLR
jgi:hypothetical protein